MSNNEDDISGKPDDLQQIAPVALQHEEKS
jgi:hypothetical protein